MREYNAVHNVDVANCDLRRREVIKVKLDYIL